MSYPHLAGTGEGHGSVAQYLTGFAMSAVLTAGAFWVVMEGAWSPPATAAAVVALAVTQICVHLFCFLHMNASSAQRWNVMAFAFTAIIIAIVVGGTLWVMHNADVNMMPHMMDHPMTEHASF